MPESDPSNPNRPSECGDRADRANAPAWPQDLPSLDALQADLPASSNWKPTDQAVHADARPVLSIAKGRHQRHRMLRIGMPLTAAAAIALITGLAILPFTSNPATPPMAASPDRALESEQTRDPMDHNADGTVDILDAQWLQRRIANGDGLADTTADTDNLLALRRRVVAIETDGIVQ